MTAKRLGIACALALAAPPAALADAAPMGGQAAVLSWLRQEVLHRQVPESEAPKVALAWADLNGDGRAEAFAYLIGSNFCGSGGCTLFVLEIRSDEVRRLARLTIAQRPIAVLDTRTRGYRDFSTSVCGGGITRCYRAHLQLRTNGTYPSNPSTVPALPPGAHERIVLNADTSTLSTADTEKRLSDIPTLRGLPAPFEVKAFVDRRMGCGHWSGEEPYDRERAREIGRALRELHCDRLAADEAKLLARHASDPQAVKALTETRDWIW